VAFVRPYGDRTEVGLGQRDPFFAELSECGARAGVLALVDLDDQLVEHLLCVAPGSTHGPADFALAFGYWVSARRHADLPHAVAARSHVSAHSHEVTYFGNVNGMPTGWISGDSSSLH
jgi:hypothetical protein